MAGKGTKTSQVWTWGVLAGALGLAGCSSGPKIKGDRELFIATPRDLRVDLETKHRSLDLPLCQNFHVWAQRDRNEAHEAAHLAFEVLKARKLWRVFVGREAMDTEKLLSNLVYANGKLFGGNPGGRVFALDVATHKVLWRTPVARRIDDVAKIGGVALTNAGDLAVTTATGKIFLLNPQTGAIKKEKDLGCSLRSAPLVYGTSLVVQGSNNALFLLDAELNLKSAQEEVPETLLFLGNATPAMHDGLLFAAYSTGEYKAYDARTGKEVWSDTMVPQFLDETAGNMLHVYASPVVDEGRVFILGHGGRLIACDALSGTKLWSVGFSGLHTPTVVGRWLFAVDSTGALFCFDKVTGKVRWSAGLPDDVEGTRPTSWTTPLVAGGHVIVVTNRGDIACFDASTGQLVRTLRTEVRNPSSAIIVDRVLYILSSQGYICAFGEGEHNTKDATK